MSKGIETLPKPGLDVSRILRYWFDNLRKPTGLRRSTKIHQEAVGEAEEKYQDIENCNCTHCGWVLSRGSFGYEEGYYFNGYPTEKDEESYDFRNSKRYCKFLWSKGENFLKF